MKPAGALSAWLATAKPGCCPCGREVSRKGARLCKRRKCRKDYMDFWRLEKRGPSRKSAVVRQEWRSDGKFRIHYACLRPNGKTVLSHHEDLPPSLAIRVGPKRRCPVCTKS